MKDLIVLGIEHSSLEQQVQAVAKRIGYSLTPDPMSEENFFIRSDQYSFVQRGVRAVDIADGIQSIDPQINGFKLQKEWMVTKYHTVLDSMGSNPRLRLGRKVGSSQLPGRLRGCAAGRNTDLETGRLLRG
jgi:Zn-dependent M28 family amino/carboxypeptidase